MNSFLSLAEERYSVRKYKNTPVEPEKMERMLKAASLAPTACNYQPQKIYVIQSEEAREKLKKVCPCTFDAPVIFLIGYDRSIAAKGRRHEGDHFGETDSSIVCSHIMFEAQELGLGSCWVGWFNSDEVKALYDIPENVEICHLLPVGYPADDSVPAGMHSRYRDEKEIVAYL